MSHIKIRILSLDVSHLRSRSIGPAHEMTPAALIALSSACFRTNLFTAEADAEADVDAEADAEADAVIEMEEVEAAAEEDDAAADVGAPDPSLEATVALTDLLRAAYAYII